MKALGAPIIGDPLYGRYDLAREEDRTYLHAYAICFKLNSETITIISDPSPGIEFLCIEFKKALEEFTDPFNTVW